MRIRRKLLVGAGVTAGALVLAVGLATRLIPQTAGQPAFLPVKGAPIVGHPERYRHDVITPDPAIVPPTIPPGMVLKPGDTIVFPPGGGTPYLVSTPPEPSPVLRP